MQQRMRLITAPRISVIFIGALALTACATSADGTQSEEGGSLSVGVYGGPTAETWDEIFGAGFREKYPEVDLTISGMPNPSSTLYTQEGDVQFDLVLGTASDVAQLASSDAEHYIPIDPTELERGEHVYDEFTSEEEDGTWTAAPVALTYYGIVLNTEVHEPSAIESWADLASPEFEGEYLMNSASFFATTDLPMFTLANGGSDTDLEPGMELLEETLPNVASVSTDLANSAAQMESQAVTVAPFFFSQFSQLLDSGVPVDMVLPEEGGYASPLYLIMSADTTNQEAALKFLDTVLAEDLQSAVQEPSAYIPVVDDTELVEKIQDRSGFSTTEEIIENVHFPDYAYLADNREDITQRIQDMLATQ